MSPSVGFIASASAPPSPIRSAGVGGFASSATDTSAAIQAATPSGQTINPLPTQPLSNLMMAALMGQDFTLHGSDFGS